MKKITPVLPLLCALTVPVHADTVFGIYAGGGSIDFDTSGTFTDLDDGGGEIDLDNDLNLSGDTGTYFYLAIEHPIPLVPNFKIARTELEETSRTVLSDSISFDGTTFPAGSTAATKMDLSHTDFTLYYEILDNWVNLDLGLTARQFDGGIESRASYLGSTYSANVDLDFTAPLLYAKAQFDLPLTGLYVGGDINWIGYSGSQFYDVWARAGYVFAFGLGVEIGYRKMQLDIDDIDDLEADVSIDGNYIAATFHF